MPGEQRKFSMGKDGGFYPDLHGQYCQDDSGIVELTDATATLAYTNGDGHHFWPIGVEIMTDETAEQILTLFDSADIAGCIAGARRGIYPVPILASLDGSGGLIAPIQHPRLPGQPFLFKAFIQLGAITGGKKVWVRLIVMVAPK